MHVRTQMRRAGIRMDSLPEKAYDIWVDNGIQFTAMNGGRIPEKGQRKYS